jgi:hypothetical protein
MDALTTSRLGFEIVTELFSANGDNVSNTL